VTYPIDDLDRGNGDPTIERRFDAIERQEAMTQEDIRIIRDMSNHPRLRRFQITFGEHIELFAFSVPKAPDKGEYEYADQYRVNSMESLTDALVRFEAGLDAHLAERDAEPKTCEKCGRSLDVPAPGMAAQEENPTNDDGLDLPPDPPYAEGGVAVFGGRL